MFHFTKGGVCPFCEDGDVALIDNIKPPAMLGRPLGAVVILRLRESLLADNVNGVASQSHFVQEAVVLTVQVYHIPNGIANIILSGFRNIAKKFSTVR